MGLKDELKEHQDYIKEMVGDKKIAYQAPVLFKFYDISEYVEKESSKPTIMPYAVEVFPNTRLSVLGSLSLVYELLGRSAKTHLEKGETKTSIEITQALGPIGGLMSQIFSELENMDDNDKIELYSKYELAKRTVKYEFK